MTTALGPFLLAASLQVVPPASAPPDTYRDEGVRSILASAIAARERDMEGILSYEGVARERVYVGLKVARFRRERGLFEGERVARIRWVRGGDRYVEWIGARYQVPLVGNSPEIQAEINADMGDDLLSDGPVALDFDPWDDRMLFGDEWLLHPLSDSAALHYRFASGDTLRLSLPMQDRAITMIEVQVEPRRPDIHLVAGSLWFDQDSGSLVRASYKPARPFDLELIEPEDADEVPGLLKPVTAEIDYVTVEYSLHEFRYWLPRRFALEGEASLGRFLHIPITVEWTVTGYRVNEESEMPIARPLPPGWTRTEQRRDRDGQISYLTVLMPPADSVINSPELSEAAVERAPAAFSDSEIDELRGELEDLLPSQARPGVEWVYGLRDGMARYNRIEGLSFGSSGTLPLPHRFSVQAQGRIGTADREPRGELTFFRGERDRGWALTGYRRLDFGSDWARPLEFTRSVSNLVGGNDQGAFFDALGVELSRVSTGRASRRTLRLFFEEHRAVSKETDFYLQRAIGPDDHMPENITAVEGSVYGGELELRGHKGVDPAGLMLSGRIVLEGAAGDFEYWRWMTSGALSHPFPFRLVGAVEAGLGMSAADTPIQRHFYLGGPETFRGLLTGDLSGSAFWFARTEIANDVAAARVVAFADFAWTGHEERFDTNGFASSVGVGGSLLDGLIRIDLAHVLKGEDGTRLHFYFDGLF